MRSPGHYRGHESADNLDARQARSSPSWTVVFAGDPVSREDTPM